MLQLPAFWLLDVNQLLSTNITRLPFGFVGKHLLMFLGDRNITNLNGDDWRCLRRLMVTQRVDRFGSVTSIRHVCMPLRARRVNLSNSQILPGSRMTWYALLPCILPAHFFEGLAELGMCEHSRLRASRLTASTLKASAGSMNTLTLCPLSEA